jgi:DNA gyrase subunit B
VNALSSWLRIEVKRDGKLYSQEYVRGVPQADLKVEGEATGSGTTVIFHPDEEFFANPTYDFDYLAQRCREGGSPFQAYLHEEGGGEHGRRSSFAVQ